MALGRRAQRLILRTERTPLRLLWRLFYRGLIAFMAAALRRADSSVSIYVKGGLGFDDFLAGASDIDMIGIVAVDGTPRKASLERAWRRLCAIPLLRNLIYLYTYDEAELEECARASCITYSLDSPSDRAAYLGAKPLSDDMSLLDRPGIFGPTRDWRLVRGPDRRPAVRAPFPHERRIAAWLELQQWSRYLYTACAQPEAPEIPYLCFKLLVEPLRILLCLVHGQQILQRGRVLEEARRLLPEEEETVRVAEALRAQIHRMRSPQLGAVVPLFVQLCSRIARCIEEETNGADVTEVELVRTGTDDLITNVHDADPVKELVGANRPVEVLPLVDWRALVVPGLPDETVAPVPGDPREPECLRSVALASRSGTYPVLRYEGLILLPATRAVAFTGATNRQLRFAAWTRLKLRGVQCAASDPVTRAVLDREHRANFPNVSGWSARDTARRAVAEHRAWLSLPPDASPSPVRGWIAPQEPSTRATGMSLARLLTAARAALFLETVDSGRPRLAVSSAAVVAELCRHNPTSRTVSEEALENLRAFRADGSPPEMTVVEALKRVVTSLGPYT